MTRIVAVLSIPFVFTLAAPVSAQETKLAQASGPTTESLTAVLKGNVPSGIQLLEDLTLTKPGADVPRELAEFSGAWSGPLYSERSGALKADWVYVFEKLALNSVTIVSMGIGRDQGSRSGSRGNVGQLWSTRYENLKPTSVAPLEVINTRGTIYSFKLKDGKLQIRSVGSDESPWVGTLQRITR